MEVPKMKALNGRRIAGAGVEGSNAPRRSLQSHAPALSVKEIRFDRPLLGISIGRLSKREGGAS